MTTLVDAQRDLRQAAITGDYRRLEETWDRDMVMALSIVDKVKEVQGKEE